MKAVDLITGIPHVHYEVIRPIMAIGGSEADAGAALAHSMVSAIGLKTAAPQGDPREAFELALQQLTETCKTLGGDAVIGLQFERRIAMAMKLQAPEIWAYGTVVRYLPDPEDQANA